MQNKILIPSALIVKLNRAINKDNFQKKHNEKLLKRLVNLFLFIEDKYEDANKRNLLVEDFVTIHRDILFQFRKRIGGKLFEYSDLIKILISAGVIQTNGSYSNFEGNKFSKGYRPLDVGQDYQEYYIEFNPKYYKGKTKEDLLNQYPECSKEIENMYKIEIDITGAMVSAMKEFREKDKKATTKADRNSLRRKYNWAINSALRLSNGIHFFKISDAGRHYTSLANAPKVITPHITYNEKKLVPIDIVNCQPLLLSIKLLKQALKGDNEELKYSAKSFYLNAKDGLFYEIMCQGKNSTKISRDEMKVELYRSILFGHRRLTTKNKLVRRFNSLYPNLITLLNPYKFGSKKSEDLQNNSDKLHWVLQNLESQIFFSKGSVTDKLNETNEFWFTKHDSIYVTEDLIDKASELIKDNLYNLTGADCALKVENFNKQIN